MISDVYKELMEKKAEIETKIEFVEDIKTEEIEKIVKEKWIDYPPKEVKGSLIAIDGGEWVKELRTGAIYIADAEVVKSDENSISVLDKIAITDILRPGNRAKEFVSLLMQLYELKFAYKYGSEADYILVDGSLSKKIGDYIFMDKDSSLDGIEIGDKIYAFNGGNEGTRYKYLIAENHVVFANLIEKYKDKLLFISKNNKSTELFNGKVSDVTFFDFLTEGTGYSEPIEKTIDGRNLLSQMASQKLDNMKYYSTYVRLSKGTKILKIDMFSKDVEKIIDILSTVSIDGYPYPLLKVHKDVKATKEDIRRFQHILNIKKRSIEWWPNQLF